MADSASKTTPATAQSTRLKDWIRGYHWSLHDLRDGISRHIELDERIVQTLPLSSPTLDILKEHEQICREVDRAIQLADDAAENEMSQERLGQLRSDLDEAVSRIRALIETHTAKEDTLFGPS